MANTRGAIRNSCMRRILEELFPFVFFYFRSKRILEKATNPNIGNKEGKYSLYHQLETESLSKRLKEEHDRGKSIDEKTVKFTTLLSIALTILGAIGGFFSNKLESSTFKLLLSTISGCSILYTITGGLLALGALKTLPTYGYGTNFIVNSKDNDDIIISALAAQEEVNIARHLRNEAAYQCLRNGFIFLITLAVLFMAVPFLGAVDPPTH